MRTITSLASFACCAASDPTFLQQGVDVGNSIGVGVEDVEAANPGVWEPSESEYWGVTGENVPYAVPEFKPEELTRAKFDKLARAGRAFVVRQLGKNHPMAKWNCDYFAENTTFKEVELEREYKAKDVPGPKRRTMSQILSDAKKAPSTGAFSPFYLGIKNAGEKDNPTWTPEVLAEVNKNVVVPEFMDPVNKDSMSKTPEFWFSFGAHGGGAKAHVDQHTMSTLSMQLSGTKKWKISPVAKRNQLHVMKLYTDGLVNNRAANWSILKEVTLSPGDAIFFGNGVIHETTNSPGECSASITHQYDVPRPTTFWRSYLPRVRETPDMQWTWQRVHGYVVKGLSSSSDVKDFFDVNGDGSATDAERKQVVSLWNKLNAQTLPAVFKAHDIDAQKHIVDNPRALRTTYPKAVQEAVIIYEKKDSAEANSNTIAKDYLTGKALNGKGEELEAAVSPDSEPEAEPKSTATSESTTTTSPVQDGAKAASPAEREQKQEQKQEQVQKQEQKQHVCKSIHIGGLPGVQDRCNGVYKATSQKSEGYPVYKSSKGMFLYWSPTYGGQWQIDTDTDLKFKNVFIHTESNTPLNPPRYAKYWNPKTETFEAVDIVSECLQ